MIIFYLFGGENEKNNKEIKQIQCIQFAVVSVIKCIYPNRNICEIWQIFHISRKGDAAMKKVKIAYNGKKYTIPVLYIKLLPIGIVTSILILAIGAWLIAGYMLAL